MHLPLNIVQYFSGTLRIGKPPSPMPAYWRMVGFLFCFDVWQEPLIGGESSSWWAISEETMQQGRYSPAVLGELLCVDQTIIPQNVKNQKSEVCGATRDERGRTQFGFHQTLEQRGSNAWLSWNPVSLIKIRVAFSTCCEPLHVSVWKLLGFLPPCSHPFISSLFFILFYTLLQSSVYIVFLFEVKLLLFPPSLNILYLHHKQMRF